MVQNTNKPAGKTRKHGSKYKPTKQERLGNMVQHTNKLSRRPGNVIQYTNKVSRKENKKKNMVQHTNQVGKTRHNTDLNDTNLVWVNLHATKLCCYQQTSLLRHCKVRRQTAVQLIIIIIIDNFCIALFSGVPKLTALYNILQHFLSFTNITHIIMTTNNV